MPELIFLLAMFGYMDALIITKWIKFDATDPNCAPNILIGYINMFLMSYPEGEDALCSDETWYPGQVSQANKRSILCSNFMEFCGKHICCICSFVSL